MAKEVSKDFPMLYLKNPIMANELRSKLNGLIPSMTMFNIQLVRVAPTNISPSRTMFNAHQVAPTNLTRVISVT